MNRARYQIENPDIIATKSRTGDVYVFDRTTFDSMPKEGEKFNPTLRLTGHDKEGYDRLNGMLCTGINRASGSYGLAWSPHKGNSTHLLSAGFDSKICQWDIAGTTKENRELEPVRTYTAHTTGVEVRILIEKQLLAPTATDKTTLGCCMAHQVRINIRLCWRRCPTNDVGIVLELQKNDINS